MMEVRRRTTLLDQMAIVHSSSNLRDLLRLRGEEDRRQEQTLTTLGSVLFGDKQDPLSSSPVLRPVLHCRNGDRKKPISSTAAATAVSRTLLDVMQEEEAAVAAVATEMEEFTSVASSSNSNNNSKINWKSFKDRLGLRRPNSAACSSVSAAGTTNPPADQTSDTSPAVSEEPASAPPAAAEENVPASASTASEPVRMDLASALAAERRLRPGVIVEAAPATPARMSLMSLLEETERAASEAGGEEKKVGDGVGGGEYVCCVCMVRRKGAAFIPCGHTFCRACSRELWVGRGDCPLCNAHILEVLDIF